MRVLAGRSSEVSQYVEDVKNVIIYAKNGVIEILPGHQNLYTTVSNTIIEIFRNNEDIKTTFIVFKGIVSVNTKKEKMVEFGSNSEVVFLCEDFIKIDKDTTSAQTDFVLLEIEKTKTKLQEIKNLFEAQESSLDERVKDELNDSFVYYTKRLEFLQLAITVSKKK